MVDDKARVIMWKTVLLLICQHLLILLLSNSYHRPIATTTKQSHSFKLQTTFTPVLLHTMSAISQEHCTIYLTVLGI